MADVYWLNATLNGDPEHPRDSYDAEVVERAKLEQAEEERNLDAGLARTDGPMEQAEDSLPPAAMEQEQRAA